jgi:D-tyrosyl-tRNA(Tyr) deacylase
MRIFTDADGKFNLSMRDTGGAALVVSQFTLYADTRKGRRPSFVDAALPEQAEPLVEQFCAALRNLGIMVATGRFGAMMDVTLTNHGPVTIWIDTADKFS